MDNPPATGRDELSLLCHVIQALLAGNLAARGLTTSVVEKVVREVEVRIGGHALELRVHRPLTALQAFKATQATKLGANLSRERTWAIAHIFGSMRLLVAWRGRCLLTSTTPGDMVQASKVSHPEASLEEVQHILGICCFLASDIDRECLSALVPSTSLLHTACSRHTGATNACKVEQCKCPWPLRAGGGKHLA